MDDTSFFEALRVMSVKDLSIFFIIVVSILCLYFLPTIFALKRRKHRFYVVPVNLLLGWTIIGWILPLISSLQDITANWKWLDKPPEDALEDLEDKIPGVISRAIILLFLALEVGLLFVPGGALSDIRNIGSAPPNTNIEVVVGTEDWYSPMNIAHDRSFQILFGWLLIVIALVWTILRLFSKNPKREWVGSFGILLFYSFMSLAFFWG